MTALQIGGMPDHVHLLLALPSTMPLSKALQLIKGGSSKWLHDTFPESSSFGSGLTT
jgi:REP element-mobilizing transposase RayT